MNAVIAEFVAADPLELAEQRARAQSLPYRGALTPPEAHAAWKSVAGAVLIDIRTEAELELVGKIPDAVNIEWKLFPGWELNPSFVTRIQRKYAPETVLILICRSGIRSDEAAKKLAKAGFENVYQVLEGFEGVLNDAGQRRVNGWRSYQLPWNQA
jgi:rhodanese-related sulfurtransferase